MRGVGVHVTHNPSILWQPSLVPTAKVFRVMKHSCVNIENLKLKNIDFYFTQKKKLKLLEIKILQMIKSIKFIKREITFRIGYMLMCRKKFKKN